MNVLGILINQPEEWKDRLLTLLGVKELSYHLEDAHSLATNYFECRFQGKMTDDAAGGRMRRRRSCTTPRKVKRFFFARRTNMDERLFG